VYRSGRRELQPAGTATTDDRGHYRIAALTPGDYIVSAAPRDELVQAAARYDEISARAKEVLAATAAREGAAVAEARAKAGAIARGPRPEDPKDAYVPVYFPGTTQMSAAATISLDVSEERPGTDLQLQLLPIGSVSGAVTWEGKAQGNASVWLIDRTVIPGGAPHRFARAAANGRFSFPNVPPGQYLLAAQASVRSRPSNPGAAGDWVQGSGPTTRWAAVELAANGEAMSGLTLPLQAPLEVTGRVVIEGAKLKYSQIRLRASPAEPLPWEIALTSAPVGEDGRFTIGGLVPGRYRIVPAAPLPGGAQVRSAEFGGRDTLDSALAVTAEDPIGEGVVTIVPRLAEIAGQAQDASSQPSPGAIVIIFAADERYWTAPSRRIQAVRPDADGRYILKDLPAGEYSLVALAEVEEGRWTDPAFLRELRGTAMSVTLAEGERREQAVRVAR
jgi:hypothetical protein